MTNTDSPKSITSFSAPAEPVDAQSFLSDVGAFGHMQRVADMYSRANMLPAHYKGSIPDVFIALQMSLRLNVDPFMFMQSTYVISGKPGMEAKLAIALVNERGPFQGPIMYQRLVDQSDNLTGVRAYAIDESGQEHEAVVDWDIVKGEGWEKKTGSKWKTMPEQMFRYRAAVFLIRSVCPEVLLGMHTKDELEDIQASTIKVGSETRPALADQLAGVPDAPITNPQQSPLETTQPEAPAPVDHPGPSASARVENDLPNLDPAVSDLVAILLNEQPHLTPQDCDDALREHSIAMFDAQPEELDEAKQQRLSLEVLNNTKP